MEDREQEHTNSHKSKQSEDSRAAPHGQRGGGTPSPLRGLDASPGIIPQREHRGQTAIATDCTKNEMSTTGHHGVGIGQKE